MVGDGSRYILLKPYINLAGFPCEEERNHLIVSVFEHSKQRSKATGRTEDFNADAQSNEEPIPF